MVDGMEPPSNEAKPTPKARQPKLRATSLRIVIELDRADPYFLQEPSASDFYKALRRRADSLVPALRAVANLDSNFENIHVELESGYFCPHCNAKWEIDDLGCPQCCAKAVEEWDADHPGIVKS